MTILSIAKQSLKKCDLFSSMQFLRFKSDAETKSMTGGLISLGIMLFLAITFTSMIFDTFNKVIIHSVVDSTQAQQPPAIVYSTYNNGKQFMLGLELWLNNITTGPRMFDILLQNTVYEQAVQTNKTRLIPFQRCTIDHWHSIPNIDKEYDKLEMSAWMCIPLNENITVTGKYSSDIQMSMDIIVKACQNETNPSWPCAPQSEIDQFLVDNGQLYWTIFFLNPLLNPQKSQYLSYYLEDKYYVISGRTYGAEMYIYNNDFQISTDQSILPFTDTHKEIGPIVDSSFSSTYVLENYTDWYVFINFFRAPSSIIITRTHQKILDALAYVGGLLGSFLLILIILNFYNEGSFELNFAAALYQPQEDSPTNFRKYNVLFYILQGIYTIFRVFKVKLQWKSTQFFYQTRKEMLKQLDVMFLFKKLHILQTAMKYMLKRSQFRGLMLHHQMNVPQARKIRKMYSLKKDIAILAKNKLQVQKMEGCDQNRSQSMAQMGDSEMGLKNEKKDKQPSIISQQREGRRNCKIYPEDINPDDYGSQSESSGEDEEDKNNRQAELLDDLKELKKDAESNDYISAHIFASIDPRIKEMLQAATEIKFDKMKSKNSILQINFDEDKMESMVASQTKKVKVSAQRRRSIIKHIDEEKEEQESEDKNDIDFTYINS